MAPLGFGNNRRRKERIPPVSESDNGYIDPSRSSNPFASGSSSLYTPPSYYNSRTPSAASASTDTSPWFQSESSRPRGTVGEQQVMVQEEMTEEQYQEGIRQLDEEGLASTRSSRHMMDQAEETSIATLQLLWKQTGGQLPNIKRHFDSAEAHTARADDEIKDLKKLNRSIFIPYFSTNNEKKRHKEEARMMEQQHQERASLERERARHELVVERVLETRTTMGRRSPYDHSEDPQDRVRQEIDDNLEHILVKAGNLKAVAIATSEVVDRSNVMLKDMIVDADRVGGKVQKSRFRLGRAAR